VLLGVSGMDAPQREHAGDSDPTKQGAHRVQILAFRLMIEAPVRARGPWVVHRSRVQTVSPAQRAFRVGATHRRSVAKPGEMVDACRQTTTDGLRFE